VNKATGKERQIRIRLSEADVRRMVKDAEANAVEDKKRREAVDAKNHADALVHSTEKALAEQVRRSPTPSAAPLKMRSGISRKR
jgi:molecular chaperone DnaK